MTEKEKPKKNPILSLFRRKIEDKNYEHDAALNRVLIVLELN
jgi:hypothetical protein